MKSVTGPAKSRIDDKRNVTLIQKVNASGKAQDPSEDENRLSGPTSVVITRA